VITLVLTATAKDRLGWLSRASPGDAGLYEAGIDSEINKTADACHAFDSSSSGLEGVATVPELRMIGASLDRFGSTSAVKPADWHPKSTGVLTAL
jgi:hypothetical protein